MLRRHLANTFGVIILWMCVDPGLKQPWAPISERFQRYLYQVFDTGSKPILTSGGEAVK